MALPYHYLRQLLFFRCAFYSGTTESFTRVFTILLQQPFFKSIQFVHASTFVDSNGLAHDMHTNNYAFIGILVTQMIKATYHAYNCYILFPYFLHMTLNVSCSFLLRKVNFQQDLVQLHWESSSCRCSIESLYPFSVYNVAFIHESSKAPRGVRCIDSRMYSVDTHRTLQLSPCWLYSLC